MCAHGDTVDVAVLIPADLSHSGQPTWTIKPIDRCIAPIVRALQIGEVVTRGSCCGHGTRIGEILLDDGRWLVVVTPPSVPATEDDPNPITAGHLHG